MDLRAELLRRSRDTRWVVGALALLFVTLVFLYYLVQRGSELPAALVTNRVLLFALRNLNAILILVIFFVLGRNLIKLWIERRSRVLGSRFKTKLVGTYIGLSLVPVLVLFFYASELLQGAIDRWFSASLANVLEQGNAVAQALGSTIEERNRRDAARLAGHLADVDLADADARARLRRRLESWQAETGALLIAVYHGDEFVNAVVDPRSGVSDLPEIGRSLPREAAQQGSAGRVVQPPGTRGRLILGAAALSPPGRTPAVVVVGTLLDPLTATRSEQLIEAFQTYRQVEVQRGDFQASYFLMFVLVTLLILLASSWMGLFLARRLVAPLQALGEAFRQVSLGDLEQRIEVPADDEMKVVVDSFHRMTDELRTSRAALESSNRDLTQANRALDAERAQIAAILENLAAGVIALDAELRVVSVNSAALQMLRLREGDLVGRTLAEAFAGDERAPLAELAAAAAEGPEPRHSAQIGFPVGGVWRTFEVRGTRLPLAAGDTRQARGLVLVLEDLTELLRAQKLATWTEAARRVAHEIKNPLTPIRLAAERLRARQRSGDEDLGRLVERAVEIIVREVANMQALVEEFSRFAKMPGPAFAASRFEPLVADLLDLYRELKEGVTVHGRVDPEVGEVWIDPEQIRRLLINLLDNAFEASTPPGRVEVVVRRSGERVEIVVADQGRGIPPADREKLFLPFFSRKRRGSGMGLAIVQRIVTDHDGQIVVEDNPPRGTRIRVSLPARGAAGGGCGRRVSQLLVGTAGHVDHGKTALLRALTGIDCDRLPEEKRRGITLDLGFAHLERQGVLVGFVDVPGHERFVHNALAGLGGIRLLLLVVAADEGVRPQTREHLAIAELLEIPELLVALTKVDLVDGDQAGLAALEVEELLAATRWAGAPIARVSSVTGEGVDELAAAIVERALVAAPPSDSALPARLPIDRVFSPRGQGVVVTGTLFQGRVAVGDELVLRPGETPVRVRGLQAHGAARAAVEAGGRAALQLAGVELAAVARGQELVAAGGPAVTRRLLARLRLLPDAPFELSGSREVRLHLAAGERPARARALLPQRLGPDGEGLVVVRTREPLVAARGDRLVLRRLSPASTLGGGTVLDPRWRRPRRLDLDAHLAALAADDDEALVAWAEAAGAAGLDAEDAGARLGRGETAARKALAALVAAGRLVSGAGRTFHPRALAALERRARQLLADHFAADRLAESMPRAELVRRLLPRPARALADFHLDWLARRSALALAGDRVAAPGRTAELSPGERGLAAAILGEYERAGLGPPSPEEVARRLAAKPEIVAGLIRHLIARARLVRLPGGLVFAATALERLAGELVASGWQSFSVAQFKERFALSRKWAIPLLEHLDATRVTRRVGDLRQLVAPGAQRRGPAPPE